MTPENVLLRVDRSILQKVFDISDEEIKRQYPDDWQRLTPTETEREWMRIFRAQAPELARVQRKMSICIEAQIDELSEDAFTYSYAGKQITVSAPKNCFRTAEVLSQRGVFAAVREMAQQGCISVDIQTLAVDELMLLQRLIDRFFFQTYIV